jgi:hypothetical protein
MSERDDSQPIAAEQLAEWVDEIADRFEAAWQGVAPPRVEEFLGEASGE